MIEEDISPELKDIFENLKRYVEANKKEVCFIASFVAFKKDKEHKCVDCGGDCDEVKDEASRLSVFGDKETLREMLNELRDIIEDESDEEGFVVI